MRMRLAILVAVMLVGASARASAGFTAGELLSECERLEKNWAIKEEKRVSITSIDGAKCWGYLRAFLDLSDAVTDDAQTRLLNACVPAGITAR